MKVVASKNNVFDELFAEIILALQPNWFPVGALGKKEFTQ
jgi:hypothetical protein